MISADGLVYVKRLSDKSFKGKPALFLDRDGVIVEETGYLHSVDDVALIPGMAKAIGEVNRAQLPVVVVTNQAGIGRGMYGWSAFESVQQRMIDLLLDEEASIDLVLACGTHPDANPPFNVVDHSWRKPAAGMLLEAQAKLDVSFAKSLLVGDKLSDIEAAISAGLGVCSLCLTGHGVRELETRARRFEDIGNNTAPKFSVCTNPSEAVTTWLYSISPND